MPSNQSNKPTNQSISQAGLSCSLSLATLQPGRTLTHAFPGRKHDRLHVATPDPERQSTTLEKRGTRTLNVHGSLLGQHVVVGGRHVDQGLELVLRIAVPTDTNVRHDAMPLRCCARSVRWARRWAIEQDTIERYKRRKARVCWVAC